jgi:hypothetical protein
LTCASDEPGTAIADFVIFPPRWMVRVLCGVLVVFVVFFFKSYTIPVCDRWANQSNQIIQPIKKQRPSFLSSPP